MTDKPKRDLAKSGPRLPAVIFKAPPALPKAWFQAQKRDEKIPNASLIYGLASSAMGAFALYHLFTGAWFTALLLFALAAVLFGFAFYFIRYAS